MTNKCKSPQELFVFDTPVKNFFKIESPADLYWVDVNGKYFGCNEILASQVGLTTQQIIGLKDEDLIWKKYAPIFRRNDMETMHCNTIKTFYEEIVTIDNEHIPVVSLKSPLHSNVGQVIGVFGVSIPVPMAHLLDMKPMTEINKTSNISSIDVVIDNDTIFATLTRREKQTLVLLAKNKTAKEIADKLSLSFRTVESYIENIRNKLHCKTKAELISLVHSKIGIL